MNNDINVWPSEKKLRDALDKALSIVEKNMVTFKGIFPGNGAKDNLYFHEDNTSWTAGFWPGILWLSYELTGDKKYSDCALSYVESFYERISKKRYVNHHDMGFLYSLSCVPAYTLFDSSQAKTATIMAANHLCNRYMEKGEFINAWSDINNVTAESYHYIIDCLMNIPLLYRVSEETGDMKYRKIAEKHLNTTMKTIIREDNSTYHSYLFDVKTGKPIRGITQQGFSDASTWSRGQAWGITGLALNYSYTKNLKSAQSFGRLTDYFIKNLPDDYVPYWDLTFKDGDEPRDSSAAAIVVCGILEMEKHFSDEKMRNFSSVGTKMLNSLIDNYSADVKMNSDGILLRGTGSVPHGMSVDEPVIFGDYFYLEAIARLLKKDWKMYW